jgi:NAD(P)-dependent dehydrogenase (short-subunit alcohol dehydrogenase family)
MAFEWGRYGIRANTVQPGAVMSQRLLSRVNTAAAGGRAGGSSDIVVTTIDELANTIVFLLSDLASGISGQTISVDSALSTKFCGGARPFEINKRNPQV